jgi:hypothetical protein
MDVITHDRCGASEVASATRTLNCFLYEGSAARYIVYYTNGARCLSIRT